jgi:hypothetical protein
VGLTSDMSQSPILGPTDKSSAPTGWCSTLSRSGYTTLLTLKEASGSRNYPMHSGATYSALQANGAISILPSLWLRSNPPCRCHVGLTSSGALR